MNYVELSPSIGPRQKFAFSVGVAHTMPHSYISEINHFYFILIEMSNCFGSIAFQCETRKEVEDEDMDTLFSEKGERRRCVEWILR